MKKIDWSISKDIANIVDGRMGECTANVVRAFLDHRNEIPKDAVFVEGLYMMGGQLGLHVWIETEHSIIEPSLVKDLINPLKETVKHYKILTRDEEEIKKLYGDKPRNPGVILTMELNWDDPRVDEMAEIADPNPGSSYTNPNNNDK